MVCNFSLPIFLSSHQCGILVTHFALSWVVFKNIFIIITDIWHAPQKWGLWDIFHWHLGLTHRYMFSLNFSGESCLFTILTKEESSRCSSTVVFHSTVSSTLTFGEDVTVLQSNACGKQNMIKSIFKCLLLKSKICAGVTVLQIDTTVWSALLKKSIHGIEQPTVGKGLGEGWVLWAYPTLFWQGW